MSARFSYSQGGKLTQACPVELRTFARQIGCGDEHVKMKTAVDCGILLNVCGVRMHKHTQIVVKLSFLMTHTRLAQNTHLPSLQ